MRDRIIILCGMPGAGKGAISKIMRWMPNTVHLSSGEKFRALDPESDLGKRVRDIMAKGELIDDATVNEVILPSLTPGQSLLLDGYPRSVAQAEYILDLAKKSDVDVCAVLLEIDEDLAMKRRDHRIKHMVDNGETPRKDDLDPEALPKRFSEFREKTAPMIEYLREKLGDNFCAIDGSGYLEDVYDNIMCKIIRN